MSRIGKIPMQIPNEVNVSLDGSHVKVKGPKGELEMDIHKNIHVEIEGTQITIKRQDDEKLSKSLHGLTRTLIANMIEGVTKGYEKKLEIRGVGYRVQIEGEKITFALGFSHPIEYKLPKSIQAETDKEKKNIITIKGVDKQLVGQIAAEIRQLRKPEPYKGKGIRYFGEYVAQKAGKTAASGSKE